MPEGIRKTVYVPPDQLDLWADLEALATEQNRPMASLVLQALEEFPLLRAFRAGKIRLEAELEGVNRSRAGLGLHPISWADLHAEAAAVLAAPRGPLRDGLPER